MPIATIHLIPFGHTAVLLYQMLGLELLKSILILAYIKFLVIQAIQHSLLLERKITLGKLGQIIQHLTIKHPHFIEILHPKTIAGFGHPKDNMVMDVLGEKLKTPH